MAVQTHEDKTDNTSNMNKNNKLKLVKIQKQQATISEEFCVTHQPMPYNNGDDHKTIFHPATKQIHIS